MSIDRPKKIKSKPSDCDDGMNAPNQTIYILAKMFVEFVERNFDMIEHEISEIHVLKKGFINSKERSRYWKLKKNNEFIFAYILLIHIPPQFFALKVISFLLL